MKNNEHHVCKELDYCICNSGALEPNDNCPKHGSGVYPKRCVICGRFMNPPAEREKTQ